VFFLLFHTFSEIYSALLRVLSSGIKRRVVHLKSTDVSEKHCHLLHAGLILGLFFSPEDGNDVFLRNFGCLSPGYAAIYTTAVRT
jgi:hypothetical protein